MIQDPREAAKDILMVFGLAALITIIVLVASTLGHAMTTNSRNNSNGLGVIMYSQNPYIYEAGSIIDYSVIGESEGLSIRVKPLATYMLFDENILFCGVPADKINGHENPMVLVYERVARRMVDGVGCHNLVQVRSIEEEKQ
jgi:hypothetical protein